MIVKRSRDQFEVRIEDCSVGVPHRTLHEAEQAYVKEMASRGQKIDPRTVMVFEYIPEAPVYKLFRIR
jgi:hypothetical protein